MIVKFGSFVTYCTNRHQMPALYLQNCGKCRESRGSHFGLYTSTRMAFGSRRICELFAAGYKRCSSTMLHQEQSLTFLFLHNVQYIPMKNMLGNSSPELCCNNCHNLYLLRVNSSQTVFFMKIAMKILQ